MTNPLRQFDTLPDFRAIGPDHVTPAIDTLLQQAEQALERAVGPDVAPDYDAMSAVLDVATERLGRAWGVVSHLNSVADTPAMREAYNANLPRVTAFLTRLGADERLYAKYKAIAAAPSAAKLSAPRRKALANALRDFVLSGAELTGAAKTRFAEIQERQAELGQKYHEHVLDATDGFELFVDAAQLDGVPEDVRQATREAALAAGRTDGTHRLTLHQPVYRPVLECARHSPLREALYRAYVTRASEFGPPERDNGPLMRELVDLRQEAAALLGHATFADMSLVPKMARSPAEVDAFLQNLATRAKPFAERDMAELRAFAATELGLPQLEAWDVAFASERLKEARYAFSEQEVKRYFTEPKVLAGLFDIVQTVFEVQIRPDTAPVWHDSVRFYRVERDGRLLAQFYLDAYARPGKQPGAWMGDARDRWARPDGRLQTPVATLQCNYAPPVGGAPSLLMHDDVITLFHEFGHGLHLMLTQVDDMGVSGLQGVEWDAVELPSQFMENFCWEWDVLQRMTAHVDTGATLPREMFDKMVAAKNFQSGMGTVRQLEFGLFDMRIHSERGVSSQMQRVLDEVRAQVAVVQPPAYNRFAHSFSHIFAGGYAAGYYSYKWAEVLSADAWSAFEETGPLSVPTGRRLREQVLEAGGSRSALENFVAFRGREPRIDALLRHQGMA